MIISKKLIIGCIQSWYDITTQVIFKKKRNVIFAAPQHFNRAANGKNPYIEKLISTCKDNGVSFLQLESPEYDAPQPRDPDAVRADLIFWLMMLINKLALKINGGDKHKAHRTVAKTIGYLTIGKLKAFNYVTMAGLFIEIFQELSPDSTVYDLQHGIIYAGHPGYFDSKDDISISLSAANCKILLWGEGYKDLFVNSSIKNVEDKVNVIGYPIEQNKRIDSATPQNTIIFSLQFTPDLDYDTLFHMKEMLDKALSTIDPKKYDIKLKHHPRHNNVIDLSDILRKYPHVVFTDETLENLISKCILNITWFSTTCFEFAAYNVPTFLLSDSRLSSGFDIYYTQFKYPVFKGLSLPEIMPVLSDKQKMHSIGESVHTWYTRLYSPCDINVIKSVLGINNNESKN